MSKMLEFMPFFDGNNENATRRGQQFTGSFPMAPRSMTRSGQAAVALARSRA
jgi:hypothetical protein